ncbi:MAG: prepilin-type N-terminal cleavage/methylation domain-containing protein [Chloroflexi bacterium]|nr:MAG: prepilin-type N-terminal cleavage/methylation domain-containing protein [Chloroflexota bacterium]
MRKLLKRALTNEAGFTLMELIVVVLIVGILAAVGVPLYLGYVRDSRLAEAKALAGATLTAAQACAQQNTGSEATNCTLALLAQRIGVTAGGVSGDGKWTVTITTVTLDVPNNRFLGGPINVAGTIAPVTNMGAAVFIDAGGVVTMRCSTAAGTVALTDPLCG